jgi:hypothetical protein
MFNFFHQIPVCFIGINFSEKTVELYAGQAFRQSKWFFKVFKIDGPENSRSSENF